MAETESTLTLAENVNIVLPTALFDWFGLVVFCKKKKMSVVIQLIPNQSNRKSTVQ